jgi:hypothetical protein
MLDARAAHTASSELRNAELYDPRERRWSLAGSMAQPDTRSPTP